jgi:hypothetical protein
MVAHPRVFLPAAVPMAILAAAFLRRAPRALAAATFLALPLVSIPAAVLLHADGDRFTEGARLAYRQLQSSGAPVVSDPRTTGLFRLYDGYRDTREWRDWHHAPVLPYYRVVNSRWIAMLGLWYGVRPPPGFEAPNSAPAYEMVLPGRRRWRPLLLGRVEREPEDSVRLYLIVPDR